MVKGKSPMAAPIGVVVCFLAPPAGFLFQLVDRARRHRPRRSLEAIDAQYGEDPLAAVLAPHGAAKWPIVSLLPFLLDPEHWPFVKPTFIERAARATGIDVEYEPLPNARTCELVRDLYEQVAVTLGERGFAPRDFIDVQTFLWVASGMAREANEERARKDK